MGLIVPAKYEARTKNKKIANILQKHLLKKKEKLSWFELTITEEDAQCLEVLYIISFILLIL